MHIGRDLLVAGIVILAHGATLWGVQKGLEHRPEPPPPVTVITAELITAAVPLPVDDAPPEPPAPTPPAPPPPAPPPPPEPPKPKPPKPKPKPPKPKPQPKPEPTPVPMPLPVENASPTAMSVPAAPVEESKPEEPAPPAASSGPGSDLPPSGASGAGSSGPSGPQTVLPSTKAAYLNNPKPQYPPMSKRLGETGTVVFRVLVGADGTAKEVIVRKSSGYERLDMAALEAIRKWRFVPGTRGGVPEDMWFNLPWKWVLND